MAKRFGSISELFKILFRQNSQEITLDSNSGTTYTADRTIELPPIDADETVLGEASTQTVTNKTIDATSNTISNLGHGSEVDEPSSGVHGVTGSIVGTTDTQTLSNKTLSGPLVADYEGFTEQNALSVAVPTSGNYNLFVDNTDATFKFKDNGGSIFTLGGGSGAGEINAIGNPDSEVNADGWATYNDGAVTDPVDGTGGTASIGFTKDTGTALRGTASFRINKPAVNEQGEGVSYDFTLDEADTNKLLKISCDYTTTGSYASDDIGIYIYDVTNAQLITVSNNTLKIATNGQVQLQFVSTDSTSYRLIFHIKTTNASASNLYFDNVIVGPGSTTIAQGAIVTAWEEVTGADQPTLSWLTLGTGGVRKTFSRRVGSSMELREVIQLGTGGDVTGSMDYTPAYGLTVNSSAVEATSGDIVGTAWARNLSGGNTYYPGAVRLNTSGTSFVPVFDNFTASGGSATPFNWDATDQVGITVVLPVTEWASTGIVILPTTDDLSITAWQAFTPTISNVTATATNEGFYRRNGDTMEIRGGFQVTTPAGSGQVEIEIPAGLNMDESKLHSIAGGARGHMGAGHWFDLSGSSRRSLAMVKANSTTQRFRFAVTEGSTVSILDATEVAASDEIGYDFSIPILEWADLGKVPAVGVQEATADAPGVVQVGQIPGVTDGSSAAAGDVGEYIEDQGGNFFNMADNTAYDVHSLVLQAGEWDVSGFMLYDPTGTDSTVESLIWSSISLTSINIENPSIIKNTQYMNFIASRTVIPTRRITLSAATTVYLVALVRDTAGTVPTTRRMLSPTIYARRVR